MFGVDSSSEFMIMWDRYARVNEPVTSKLPVFYGFGNHGVEERERQKEKRRE
jgi:hypothetical protein